MSADRVVAPGRTRPKPSRRGPVLRMLPGGTTSSPRGPFVVLVLMVLGVGLVGLLLLNTALQQGAFALDELTTETTELRDRATTLSEEVASRAAPQELARRARLLDMVPAEAPEFLQLGAGQVEDGSR